VSAIEMMVLSAKFSREKMEYYQSSLEELREYKASTSKVVAMVSTDLSLAATMMHPGDCQGYEPYKQVC
jgi:hypothetical protein